MYSIPSILLIFLSYTLSQFFVRAQFPQQPYYIDPDFPACALGCGNDACGANNLLDYCCICNANAGGKSITSCFAIQCTTSDDPGQGNQALDIYQSWCGTFFKQ
jgi:CFEM domain